MHTQFDDFADEYSRLLHDPIREAFSPGSHFFLSRKVILIRDYFRRREIATNTVRWLDIGCGQGGLLRAGSPHFAEAAGCDPSAGMLQACVGMKICKQESPVAVPFPDAAFDLVTAVCVLHHVERPQRAILISEASRVLKPGGYICLIEHNPLNPVTRLIVSRTPVDADANLLTAAESRRLLREAGFQTLETNYFLYLPERMYAKLAWLEAWLRNVSLGGQYAVFGHKASS